MAGAGYKLFNTGDVLTAAQVNTYLQEQTVMVFADAAARTTALSGVLAEGMASYLKDTDSFEVYNGSAWVSASGDLTALTAGTGISISSATGPVPTVTNSMATEITAAGDIIVGTGSGTFDNLPIGTTGQVLTADTTVSPYKVKWATAGGGSLPNWTAYTPSSSGAITQGNGTLTARYMESNTTVIVQIKFAFGSTSSISGATFFSLPVSIKTNNFFYGNVYLYDNGAANYAGAIQAQGTTTYLYALSRPATYVEFSSVGASVPHTWTNTDEIFVVLVYEKA